MRRRFLLALAPVVLLAYGLAGARVPQAERPPSAASPRVLAAVVLARPDSAYRPLAQEIAAFESIPLADSVTEALALAPTFLLWVVSPTELSDQTVTAFNLALNRTSSRPSTGVITGSTLGHARDLYQRATRVKGDRAAAVLGELVFTTAQIVETVGERQQSQRLSGTADVLDVLKRVDYVHYAGHGGSGYWRPLNNERITADDLSRLPPVVISTMSCQTTRIWERGSIGLRMVDEGAAAYSGFYYSPIAGFQIGEHGGPFRHTWPEVPIGHVVEAMNAGARKGYARFPFHLLLGDPRIALRSEPPCRLLDHGESGGVRALSCSGAPSGLVPVRIRGGARYAFVEISGSTAAWDREPFYNRRVQMATIGDDRILLVEHRGGDLQIKLRHRPPLVWLATDPLADALDDLLISKADRRHGGDVIPVVLAAIATLVAATRARRKRFERVHIVPAAAVGVIAAVLHASYALARQGSLVVISKAIAFSPLAAVGTGVLVGCGAFFFLAARSWRGRLSGTVIATSVGWVGGVIALGITTVTNAAIASRTGIGVWIYKADFHPFILSALGCAACAVAFSTTGRIAARVSADTKPTA
jgi:hypothetical protein